MATANAPLPFRMQHALADGDAQHESAAWPEFVLLCLSDGNPDGLACSMSISNKSCHACLSLPLTSKHGGKFEQEARVAKLFAHARARSATLRFLVADEMHARDNFTAMKAMS